jgi:hypothetical protein
MAVTLDDADVQVKRKPLSLLSESACDNAWSTVRGGDQGDRKGGLEYSSSSSSILPTITTTTQPSTQEALVDLDSILLSYGFFRGDSRRRARLIEKIRRVGDLDESGVVRLLTYARDTCKARNPVGMVCKWLEQGSWPEVLEPDKQIPAVQGFGDRPAPRRERTEGEVDEMILAVLSSDLRGKQEAVAECAQRLGLSEARVVAAIEREQARARN